VGGVHLVYDVAWSPDGSKLAFMAGPDDTSTHIYVVNRDGSAVVQVTDHPSPDSSPAWQPVLAADRSLTPQPTVLPQGTISLPTGAVSEGTLLLWTDAGAEILRAGSGRSVLVPGIRTPLDLSPDGSMVLGSTQDRLESLPDDLVSVDLRTGESLLDPAVAGEFSHLDRLLDRLVRLHHVLRRPDLTEGRLRSSIAWPRSVPLPRR
jgi:hypothetical protein